MSTTLTQTLEIPEHLMVPACEKKAELDLAQILIQAIEVKQLEVNFMPASFDKERATKRLNRGEVMNSYIEGVERVADLKKVLLNGFISLRKKHIEADVDLYEGILKPDYYAYTSKVRVSCLLAMGKHYRWSCWNYKYSHELVRVETPKVSFFTNDAGLVKWFAGEDIRHNLAGTPVSEWVHLGMNPSHRLAY